jgi:hypothetical protein
MTIQIVGLMIVAAALLYRFGRPYMINRRTKHAADWPETEATIQSAKMELVERVGHIRERVPFFSFSYVVESEYYSGRFGLRVDEDRGNVLIREWIDTKVTLRYDPKQPSIFSVPDELSAEGFRVETILETDLASEH